MHNQRKNAPPPPPPSSSSRPSTRNSNRPKEFSTNYSFDTRNVEVIIQTTYAKKMGCNWLRIHDGNGSGSGKFIIGKSELDNSCKYQRFSVELVNGNSMKFKSSVTNKYVQYKAGAVDCDGNGNKFCEFIYHRHGAGQVKLESKLSRGKYLVCNQDGQIVTGTGTIFIFFCGAAKNLNSPLDKKIISLMTQLNLPKNARDGILKLPVAQKEEFLKQHILQLAAQPKVGKHSGKKWSQKMVDPQCVTWRLLKEFEVIVKSPEAGAKFCSEFIQELGLKRLCRIIRTHSNTQIDTQILLIFKAIIDSNQTSIRAISNDEQITTIIVSKLDSSDHKVREHAIKLLVTLAKTKNKSVTSKIMASLLDSARLKGYRNRWKTVICHLSVNELSGNGSYEYDMYAMMLINFVIRGLKSIEERTDERRLLNSLKLNESLIELGSKIDESFSTEHLRQSFSSNGGNGSPTRQRNTTGTSERCSISCPTQVDDLNKYFLEVANYKQYQALSDEITAYNALHDEDLNELRKTGVIDDENDLSSPKGLFKVVHDQALDDGYINDFTSILKNLVTIPASGDSIWTNIAKIVQEACRPDQQRRTVTGRQKTFNNVVVGRQTSTYLSFKELQHVLKVQKVEEEKERENRNKNNGIEAQLNDERIKNSELEKQVQELQNMINELKAGGATVPSASSAPASVQDDGLDKFRKMVKMQTPKQAIINKMKEAGVDSSIIMKFELNGELPKNAATPPPTSSVQDDGLDKFRKMLKMKTPKQAIINKMKEAKVDSSIIMKFELTGELPESVAAPPPSTANDDNASDASALTPEEEKKLAKYTKMKNIGMPAASIRNKMRMDKIDAALVAKFFGEKPSTDAKKKIEPKWPANLKKKAEIKPKKKMRNLQWIKIDPFAVETSIWNLCDDSKIRFSTTDLENTFAEKVVDRKKSKSANDGRRKIVVEKIHILDTRRSYNIEIFFTGLKMDPNVVKNALLNMDEKRLNIGQVNELKNFTPTPDEASMFDAYGVQSSDIDRLAVAERFCYVIRNIDPHIPQRCELWAFKMNFDKILAEQKEKLHALSNALQCVKRNNYKSLRDLFSLILAFGNYMNGGTRKGQAHGFKICSLSQLTECKSENGQTLMEYLYLYSLKNNKNLLNFIDEWASLESAVSVDVPTLRLAVNQINVKLNLINNRTKSTNSLATDRFASVMKPFYGSASRKFENIKKTHVKIMKDLADLATFLNEKNDKNGQFLKTLDKFRKQFIFTMKQCEEREKREEEKKKREQWKANKKSSISKQNNAK